MLLSSLFCLCWHCFLRWQLPCLITGWLPSLCIITTVPTHYKTSLSVSSFMLSSVCDWWFEWYHHDMTILIMCTVQLKHFPNQTRAQTHKGWKVLTQLSANQPPDCSFNCKKAYLLKELGGWLLILSSNLSNTRRETFDWIRLYFTRQHSQIWISENEEQSPVPRSQL